MLFFEKKIVIVFQSWKSGCSCFLFSFGFFVVAEFASQFATRTSMFCELDSQLRCFVCGVKAWLLLLYAPLSDIWQQNSNKQAVNSLASIFFMCCMCVVLWTFLLPVPNFC
jgi:hypothetical protein